MLLCPMVFQRIITETANIEKVDLGNLWFLRRIKENVEQQCTYCVIQIDI